MSGQKSIQDYIDEILIPDNTQVKSFKSQIQLFTNAFQHNSTYKPKEIRLAGSLVKNTTLKYSMVCFIRFIVTHLPQHTNG